MKGSPWFGGFSTKEIKWKAPTLMTAIKYFMFVQMTDQTVFYRKSFVCIFCQIFCHIPPTHVTNGSMGAIWLDFLHLMRDCQILLLLPYCSKSMEITVQKAEHSKEIQSHLLQSAGRTNLYCYNMQSPGTLQLYTAC